MGTKILERVGHNRDGRLWAVFDEEGEVLLNGLEYYDEEGVVVGDAYGEVLDCVECPEDLLTYPIPRGEE